MPYALQAALLRLQPEVLSVTPDSILTTATITTPTRLGLSARNGIWSQLGGPKKAGKGVQIAVIDTGEVIRFGLPPTLCDQATPKSPRSQGTRHVSTLKCCKWCLPGGDAIWTTATHLALWPTPK